MTRACGLHLAWPMGWHGAAVAAMPRFCRTIPRSAACPCCAAHMCTHSLMSINTCPSALLKTRCSYTDSKRVLVPMIHGQALLPDLKITGARLAADFGGVGRCRCPASLALHACQAPVLHAGGPPWPLSQPLPSPPTDSSEALLTGRAPPFRLAVRAVHRSGEPFEGVQYALSEPFVVATARVKGAAKLEIPHVDDHVSKIDCVGLQVRVQGATGSAEGTCKCPPEQALQAQRSRLGLPPAQAVAASAAEQLCRHWRFSAADSEEAGGHQGGGSCGGCAGSQPPHQLGRQRCAAGPPVACIVAAAGFTRHSMGCSAEVDPYVSRPACTYRCLHAHTAAPRYAHPELWPALPSLPPPAQWASSGSLLKRRSGTRRCGRRSSRSDAHPFFPVWLRCVPPCSAG